MTAMAQRCAQDNNFFSTTGSLVFVVACYFEQYKVFMEFVKLVSMTSLVILLF